MLSSSECCISTTVFSSSSCLRFMLTFPSSQISILFNQTSWSQSYWECHRSNLIWLKYLVENLCQVLETSWSQEAKVYMLNHLLQFRVNKNIKPIYLEAILHVYVLVFHYSGDIVLTWDDHFDDDIIDSLPHQFHINSCVSKMSCQSWYWPFWTIIILVCRRVLHEVFMILVDRVVCEMRKLQFIPWLFIHSSSGTFLVRFWSKPN